MPMTEERFLGMVQRLESQAAKDPGGYARRVLLVAGLGYAYLAGVVLTAAVAAAAVVVWLWPTVWSETHDAGPGFAIALGATLLILRLFLAGIRALLIDAEPLDGVRIGREQAPWLFALLDDLAAALQAERVHAVWLHMGFNAGVAYRPRLGFLGWDRPAMVLGLPLLLGVSREQLRVILAHEMAHLSRQHGGLALRVHGVRHTWQRFLDVLEEDGADRWVLSLFGRFASWYAPYFWAYSFVMERMFEYDADRLAAEIVGAERSGDALVATAIRGRLLEDAFWPEFLRLAEEVPDPPDDLVVRIGKSLRAGPSQEDAQRWLAEEVARERHWAETHPSLAERLAALRCSRLMPPVGPLAETAADYFLGDQAADVAEGLTRTWQADVAEEWRHCYAGAEELRRQEVDAEPTPVTLEQAEALRALPLDDADALFSPAAARRAYLPPVTGGRVGGQKWLLDTPSRFVLLTSPWLFLACGPLGLLLVLIAIGVVITALGGKSTASLDRALGGALVYGGAGVIGVVLAMGPTRVVFDAKRRLFERHYALGLFRRRLRVPASSAVELRLSEGTAGVQIRPATGETMKLDAQALTFQPEAVSLPRLALWIAVEFDMPLVVTGSLERSCPEFDRELERIGAFADG